MGLGQGETPPIKQNKYLNRFCFLHFIFHSPTIFSIFPFFFLFSFIFFFLLFFSFFLFSSFFIYIYIIGGGCAPDGCEWVRLVGTSVQPRLLLGNYRRVPGVLPGQRPQYQLERTGKSLYFVESLRQWVVTPIIGSLVTVDLAVGSTALVPENITSTIGYTTSAGASVDASLKFVCACGAGCQSCRDAGAPSARCLACEPGHVLAANGRECVVQPCTLVSVHAPSEQQLSGVYRLLPNVSVEESGLPVWFRAEAGMYLFHSSSLPSWAMGRGLDITQVMAFAVSRAPLPNLIETSASPWNFATASGHFSVDYGVQMECSCGEYCINCTQPGTPGTCVACQGGVKLVNGTCARPTCDSVMLEFSIPQPPDEAAASIVGYTGNFHRYDQDAQGFGLYVHDSETSYLYRFRGLWVIGKAPGASNFVLQCGIVSAFPEDLGGMWRFYIDSLLRSVPLRMRCGCSVGCAQCDLAATNCSACIPGYQLVPSAGQCIEDVCEVLILSVPTGPTVLNGLAYRTNRTSGGRSIYTLARPTGVFYLQLVLEQAG